MISRAGIQFMRLLARLPLSWVRALGRALGVFLYWVIWPRRHVVEANLRTCFPQWSEAERKRATREVFIHVAQAWLDRGWLWHGDPQVTRRRLVLTGAVRELAGTEPTLVFAPHFVGMDAGWTALTQQVARRFVGIYTKQSNAILDAWILQGRHRFGQSRPFGREQGVRGLVSALRDGEVMYLLPDMNFGPEESIFVPFYGVSAATVPSLSRFARLGRAKVVPVITRLTPGGYEVRVLEAWAGFPTADVAADTARMNERLQEWIDTMPAQYYWVHKRFKTRPPGAPPVY
jgi:KDO2-lipid IV(A) lauroyltransferase